MIIIHVTTTVNPSNTDAFEKTIQKVCDDALKLKGCIAYTWFRDHHVKNGYMVYGEFESMTDFKVYKESEVVKKIVTEVIPLTSSKPKYRHFDGEVFEQG
ncbi:putative quinol monooxygenase [Tunicatimonas pelagia]|uniref:putative quinol monooxygenase n=1 Tax=Tunicatimonas pelagia TaxID=931531 RepID=UPI002666C213|nr:antibiotic biosynthesis monooxygenase [Tunicatimonas pelagia]WKN43190.1 antibiotic biosynthesis monooxygenase [Tunicatimonas pelagia]